MNKVELLSPAGSLHKLKYAVMYGADAVYAGLKGFSLRSAGLTLEEFEEGIGFVKSRNKKIYCAINIFAHNENIEGLEDAIAKLSGLKPDAFIVADPGIVSLIKEKSSIPVHLSTQANVTNYKAARFWQEAGVKRITLARELQINEIKDISDKIDIETEVFVHGAMCLSYSGRCYLSRYIDGRDANRGDCAQPCRWGFYLQEEKKPGEYFPVGEEEEGAYILSSKDLRLLEFLPDLVEAGVKSLKIEGRMKSIHYVAAVTKVYRQALDKYYENPEEFKIDDKWLDELEKVSHRPYSTGFINVSPGTSHDRACRQAGARGTDLQVKSKESYFKTADFVGEITGKENGHIKVAVRNKLSSGEKLDVLTPQGDNLTWEINNMTDWASGAQLDIAHANYVVKVEGNLPEHSLLRRSNAN